MSKYLKPSQYAKRQGTDYRTAVKHFHQGLLPGYQYPVTNTIYIENPDYQQSNQSTGNRVALYARVSSTTNKNSLEGQLERLTNYAAAKGYQVVLQQSEIASGLNDNRTKLNRLLKSNDWDILLVEHKDRLTRFGFNQLQLLLNKNNQRIEVINEVTDKDNELLDDFVSIVTSFAGRIYGANRKKRTEQLIAEVKREE